MLYLRLPYDKSIFAKLQSPRHMLFLLLASSPSMSLRCAIFTLVFVFIAFDNEEGQVDRHALHAPTTMLRLARSVLRMRRHVSVRIRALG